MFSGPGERRRASFGIAIALGLLAATGCRNNANRNDPFLSRCLVPPPPAGSYPPPGAQPGMNVQPGFLVPPPGAAGASLQTTPNASGISAAPAGAILPASDKTGITGGWTEAPQTATTETFDRSASTSPSSAEPRRLDVATDARPLAGESTAPAAQSASPTQFTQPAATASSSLQWTAPPAR